MTTDRDGRLRRRWSRPRARALIGLRRVRKNDYLILLVLSLGAGVAAAYAAMGFRELYLLVQWVVFGTRAEELYSHAATLPAWQLIAAPAAGGLAIGLFVRFVMPDRRPHGVPDVIEAVALRDGRMSAAVGLGAAVVNAVSIGAGASVGREGPVVHFGASMSAVIGRYFGLSRAQTVTLLGCGVASAVSASFNAPIAGVFFALEVVIGHYALSAFAPIVLASVVGTMISRVHFGNFPAFILPEHSSVFTFEFPAFALLGICSAILAIVFMRSVDIVQNVFARTPVPAWLRPMAGGLLVGLIAVAFPNVLGVGYGSTDAALKETFALEFLIALIVAKTAATAIALGSGFGGGVFSPSLFLGAMLGGAFGIVATSLFPEQSSGTGAYTLVGMGAVAGSVLGAPISTILIIVELTADYALTIAVMVAVVIASVITQQVHGRSFFVGQLERRGVDVTGDRETRLLSRIRVRDLMKDQFTAVSPAADMAEVRERLPKAPYTELFVLDDDGTVLGTITLAELSEAAFDTSLDRQVKAGDVARHDPPVLVADAGIEDALGLMRESGEEHIGVVADRDTKRLVGFVHQVDVMLAYNRALIEARREERGEM